MDRGKAKFSKATRDALARRVNNRCSFPQCDRPCFGPSQEGPGRVSDAGTACHIIAQADGPSARRVDTLMSETKRKSADNGIWMCRDHGKIIDDDERTYSVEMLRTWKSHAERKAQLSQQFRTDANLFEHDENLNSLAPFWLQADGADDARQKIGSLILQASVENAWGRENSHALRDLLIEVARNAFQHGGAKLVEFQVEPRTIVILDNGSEFDWTGLNNHAQGSGGALAVAKIADRDANQFVFAYRRADGFNRTSIGLIKSRTDLKQVTNCFLEFDDYYDDEKRNSELVRIQHCNTVYIMSPTPAVYSDHRSIFSVINQLSDNGHMPIVVFDDDTSAGVIEYFGKLKVMCIKLRL